MRLTHIYHWLCIYCIFCILTRFSFSFKFFFPLFKQIFSPKVHFHLTFIQQHSFIVWLLFDYCLITVQYSDPRNIFQVFRSCKEVPITYNLESINNKSSTWLAYFCLSSLRARLYGPGWVSHLPWLLLILRAAPRKTAASYSQRWSVGQPLLCPGSSWPRSGSPSRRGSSRDSRKLSPTSICHPWGRLQSSRQSPRSYSAPSLCGMEALLPLRATLWWPFCRCGSRWEGFQDLSPAGARGYMYFIAEIHYLKKIFLVGNMHVVFGSEISEADFWEHIFLVWTTM